MPITGLSAQKCKQRNRIAARRDGVNAVPVRLLRTTETLDGQDQVALGAMPANEAEALQRINALQPDGATPVTADDVWIHYCEAANDGFIGDRFMFLDPATTLRNIASDAESGVAFMNSHRTGGLSEPCELPFGRTFCGQYQEYRDRQGLRRCRTLVGFYMVRGVRPNGANGPSTDDLHLMIDSGTLFDVSVGLWPGPSSDEICDVCGNSLYGYDDRGRALCPHIPGTARAMTPEQVEAQQVRGVTKGYASFTLVGYRMGEVSGVYDGAVPGAGFRKGLAHFARGEVDETTLSQCRESYASLIGKRDFATGGEANPPTREQVFRAVSQLLGWDPEPAEPGSEDSRGADTGTTTDFDNGEPPAGCSFETQLTTALAAVQGCTERGDALQALRAAEGRTLSPARLEQLAAVHQATGELLARCREREAGTGLAALRLRRLRRARELRPELSRAGS